MNSLEIFKHIQFGARSCMMQITLVKPKLLLRENYCGTEFVHEITIVAATGGLREVEQAATVESSGVDGFAKQGRNQIWFPGEARRRRFRRSSAGGAVFDEVRKLQRRWSAKKTGGKHRWRPSVRLRIRVCVRRSARKTKQWEKIRFFIQCDAHSPLSALFGISKLEIFMHM
ncbi:hypothetical protein U1Q18_002608 [Sarracenia purpurea var. burkii]